MKSNTDGTNSAQAGDIILDLKHHHSCSQEGTRLLSRLTKRAKISELLDSLGGARSIEIRFSGCPEKEGDQKPLFTMP